MHKGVRSLVVTGLFFLLLTVPVFLYLSLWTSKLTRDLQLKSLSGSSARDVLISSASSASNVFGHSWASSAHREIVSGEVVAISGDEVRVLFRDGSGGTDLLNGSEVTFKFNRDTEEEAGIENIAVGDWARVYWWPDWRNDGFVTAEYITPLNSGD